MTDTTLLHISDLHFGPHFSSTVAESVLELFQALKPDALIVSGDFTQRAKKSEFHEARDFLEKLNAPVRVMVPGNHDIPLFRVWERCFSPYDLYQAYISNELNTFQHCGEHAIAALDTTAPRRRITNGHIQEWQVDYLRKCFDQHNGDGCRIVVGHHHLTPTPTPGGTEIIPGSEAILQVFAELNVDLYLCGHMHHFFVGDCRDVYSSLDRQIISVCCGTTTSKRGRGEEFQKHSLNIIHIGEEMVGITHHLYDWEEHTFEKTSTHTFSRSGEISD